MTAPKVTLRFPTRKMLDDLRRIAAKERRSLNFILIEALEEFIANRK